MKKIVIVDHYTGITDMLLLAFGELDIQTSDIEIFSGPTQALDYVQGNGARLVITDIETGRQSDADLVEMIKLGEKNIPIIVTSSFDTYEKTVLELGAHSFFRKPFDVFSMIDTCQEILEQKVQ